MAAGDIRNGGLHARLSPEHLIVAGQGQKPQHMWLRRGQHHIAAAVPGQLPHPQQGTKRAAIDEIKRRYVDDQTLTPRHEGRDNRLGGVGVGNIQIPAQGHDNATDRKSVV